MKKKLFVFGVLAMVVLFSACKPAVKGGDTSNSETPLELTAANLAGRWVLESDSTKWYEFKKDGTAIANIAGTPRNRYYKIISNKVQLYTDSSLSIADDPLQIKIYKQYCLIKRNAITNEARYNKAKSN